MSFIPFQECHQQLPRQWSWYVCNTCHFRVCGSYLGQHRGAYAQGFKCSRCISGQMQSRSSG